MARPWADFLYPNDRAASLALDEQVKQGREVLAFENRYRHKDGSYRWLSWRAKPFPDEGLIYAGVTERKLAEEELRASERRFRQLADAMAQIVWTARSDGEIDYLNLRWTEFTGLPQDVGNAGWSQILHADDPPFARRRWAASLQNGEPFEMELRLFDRREQSYRWHLIRTVAVKDDGSDVVRWFGTSTDIDGQKRAEESSRFLPEASSAFAGVVDYESTLQKVANFAIPHFADWSAVDVADGDGQLRRLAVEFLATLAHELRNPLAPLRNGLQVLRMATPDEEMADEAHTMMERQLAQMVHLIDDLLDLSRISRGKIELRKERLELAKALGQAVETSRPTIEQAGHDLLIDVPSGPISVDADMTRLAQVFCNLLNNAAKYTEPGGQIRLSVRRHGAEAVVSVRDNGVGIPAQMLPFVFEMFTQVDRNLERSQGGLGIGLSIVKRLVEMHGGSIEAKSDGHGRGSEFVVRLPIVMSLVPTQNDEAKPKLASNRRRVLVVDDNRDAAKSLAMMLKLMGNETKTAHDGLEALDVAAAYQPDLILLDIGMPKLNGYDTARHIREQPWSKGVVLVALTGWGQDEDRRKSQEAGFDLHMIKPIEPSALEKILASLKSQTS